MCHWNIIKQLIKIIKNIQIKIFISLFINLKIISFTLQKDAKNGINLFINYILFIKINLPN